MKNRIICVLAIVFIGCILYVLCVPSNESKILELEAKIAELEEANESNELFIKSWQSQYDRAKEMYDSVMSLSNPDRDQANYAKESMNEATKEINALTREIDLNNLAIENYKKEIQKLKE